MIFSKNSIQVFKNFANKEDMLILTNYLDQFNPNSPKNEYYVDYMGDEHKNSTKITDQKVIDTMHKIDKEIIENNVIYFNNIGLEPTERIWDRGLELIRWGVCEGLGPHADGSSDTPEYPKYLLAALLYLNDEYDGGEISFPDYDIIVRPEPGDLVYFPSHFIHQVMPILDGDSLEVMHSAIWETSKIRRYTMPVFYTYHIKEKE